MIVLYSNLSRGRSGDCWQIHKGSQTPNTLYKEDHKFTLQVSARAGNTRQVFRFSALGTIQQWLFYPFLPALQKAVMGLYRVKRILCFPHTCAAECGLAWISLQIDTSNHTRLSLFADLIISPGSQTEDFKVRYPKLEQKQFGFPIKNWERNKSGRTTHIAETVLSLKRM